MANEYADLADLKLALQISDDARNSLLNKALSAASRSIDDHCGRRFYADADVSARVYRPNNRTADDVFLVDDIASETGLVVERGNATDGWTSLTPSDYYPENAAARGEPITGLVFEDYIPFGYRARFGIPFHRRDRLRVTAKWGFPTVPDQVVQATLILAARLYRRKDTPEGVLGSAEWGTVRLSRTDPDVAELVSRYVLDGFA